MKRLLLDYLRRKAWILALCALPVTGLGMAVATPKEEVNAHLTGVVFQFAFIMAALPLSLDLQKGVLRVTSLFPLTGRQLGRTWWWAGVGVPSALISVLLLVAGLITMLLFPSVAVRWDALLLCAVSIWLWLGSAFTVLFNFRKDLSRGWPARAKTAGSGFVWALMAGGGFLLTRWIESYVGVQIALLLIGTILTALGWSRAEFFVLSRAATPASVSSTQASAFADNTAKPETGGGGLTYLMTRSCIRATLMGGGMLLFTPVIMVISNGKSWDAAIKASVDSSPMPFWFVFIFSLLPALTQLKFLRTLPLSSDRLALSLLLMLILPCVALGAIKALCVQAVVPGEVFNMVERHIVALCPLSLILPVVLWSGLGKLTYLLLVGFVVFAQSLPAIFSAIYGRQAEPGPLVVAGALLTLPLAFVLARFALARGGKASRANTLYFTSVWGGAR
jgi:hypothetical protein